MLAVFLFALAVVAEAWGSAAPAGQAPAEAEVPSSRQAVIVLRALAYDGNLRTRAGDTIDIGVLYKKGHGGSEQMAATMAKAFGVLASTQVAGLPIAVSRLAYGGTEALDKSIGGVGIDMIYVCEGLDAEVGAIAEVTRRTKTLTVGSGREQVRQGLSLGVFQVDAKTTILLNLQSSRQEGVAFAADLLRLAAVIR